MNLIAPEHLEIDFPDAEQYVDKIQNAGAIFIGPYTPEPSEIILPARTILSRLWGRRPFPRPWESMIS